MVGVEAAASEPQSPPASTANKTFAVPPPVTPWGSPLARANNSAADGGTSAPTGVGEDLRNTR